MAAGTVQKVRGGVIAGTIAMFLMILVQGSARLAAGVPMFPELLDELVTRPTHPPLFSRAPYVSHFWDRPLLFASLLFGQIVVGAIIGGLVCNWLGPRSSDHRSGPSPWINGLILAAALWVATGLVILPSAGQGAFGVQSTVGAIGLNLALIVGFALYGLTTVATLRVIDDASAVATLTGPEGSREQSVASLDRRSRTTRRFG